MVIEEPKNHGNEVREADFHLFLGYFDAVTNKGQTNKAGIENIFLVNFSKEASHQEKMNKEVSLRTT